MLHVRGGLDLRQELQRDVCNTHEQNHRTRHVASPVVIQRNRSDKDVEDTATEEAEVEGREARHPWRDLELEHRGRETEDYDVRCDDEAVTGDEQISACA